MIKKAAMHQLLAVKDPTTTDLSAAPVSSGQGREKAPSTAAALKANPEMKELWGWIYRGVGFALVWFQLALRVAACSLTLFSREG